MSELIDHDGRDRSVEAVAAVSLAAGVACTLAPATMARLAGIDATPRCGARHRGGRPGAGRGSALWAAVVAVADGPRRHESGHRRRFGGVGPVVARPAARRRPRGGYGFRPPDRRPAPHHRPLTVPDRRCGDARSRAGGGKVEQVVELYLRVNRWSAAGTEVETNGEQPAAWPTQSGGACLTRRRRYEHPVSMCRPSTPWPDTSRPCPNSSAARSPGTRARRWQPTPASASPPVSPSTSATHAARGNAAPTKHQRTATPVLPQTQRPRPPLPTRPRHHRRRTQRTPRQTLGWTTPSQILDQALP
jgi:hypothetical protein